MTEQTKKELMTSIYKIAQHYEIPNATLVSFKKRNLLLELIQAKNTNTSLIINSLLEAELKLDRIENDKEKQLKKPEHWKAENESAQLAKEKAWENLNLLLKTEGID